MKLRVLAVSASMAAAGMLAFSGTAMAQPRGSVESVVIQSQNALSTPTVTAIGVINATGLDEQVTNNEDILQFPLGTLTIDHFPTRDTQSFNPVGCVMVLAETGNYVVAGGTGAYIGASGQGIYHLSLVAQGCDQNAPPAVFSQIIHASGPFSLSN